MKKRLKAFFRNHPTLKIKPKEIAKKLKLNEFEYEQMKHTLRQLEKEFFIERVGKRYLYLPEMSKELKGTFLYKGEGKGYGFVVTDDKVIRDVFIPNKFIGRAIDGDTVEVELLAKKRGKNFEGKIINILERKHKELVGTLRKSKSFWFVIPEDENIPYKIIIPPNMLKGAKSDDKVVVGDLVWDDDSVLPEGKVVTVLGKAGSYDVEINSIAQEFGFSPQFEKKVLSEAKKIKVTIPEEEIKSRVDFRAEPTFTIDPADAKDFDDALSISKLENGNYKIGIHIADVTHYAKKGTAIFEEAQERATSVYFVGKVVPMLPERLSNNICSLVPKKDRLTFSVIVEMTPRGKVVNSQIAKTVIRSKKRFNYEEAQEILNRNKGIFYEELNTLNKIAKKLRRKRFNSGSINFHSAEVKFTLDKNGVPLKAEVKKEIDTNHLVEEYMLLANKIVATTIGAKKNKSEIKPFVYRVHDLPDTEKLKEFAKFVKSLGYSFDYREAKNAKQFQRLLQQVKGTEEEAVINEVAIRSMAKAKYSVNNIGHYGLGFKYYTHFTSPIRRFPDMVVHDLLHGYLNGKSNYTLRELDGICEHSSSQEMKATQAERISIKYKQIEFMINHIGDVFNGIISGVTNYGIFVQITETLAEGLIRLKDMNNDFYIYDEKNYSLVGRRTKRVFRLGDKIKVQVVRVDEKKKLIDFALYDSEQ